MSVLGTTIHGYSFIEFLDSGNFGSVYKATKDGITYAIKIFREDYVLTQYKEHGENNRIKREIEIMKSVDHQYLIKYIDDFKEDTMGVSSYFLVMEFAEGNTLRKYMNGIPLPAKEAKDIFNKILSGLDALHNVRGDDEDKGIIHRDLKPENIFITDAGNIKILDFGLSKVIDYTSITTTGDFIGSPLYMSPEQITDSKNIDKRSDLYTAGVIFYEMLTAQKPYEFSSLPELLDKIKSANPIPPRRWIPMINNKLENIILKLLEKEPYQRFNSAYTIGLALTSEEPLISMPAYDLEPKFLHRLWNEKSVLEEFLKHNNDTLFVEFPANHQIQQKGLVAMTRFQRFRVLIDPATMRLAYPAQDDIKGLQALPYAPPKFEVITPDYLKTALKQREYVKQVIDEQVKLGADILISPYHYIHNTNVPATRTKNPVDEWFDLDIKLLKESIDYKNSSTEFGSKHIYAGICLNGDSLLDKAHRTDLLNLFSAFDCDGFFIYVDCIDNKTNSTVLYHYVKTLVELQASTGKPVIAGRLNMIGLGLLCAGVSAFSSGAARFDSFYEGLYKEESEAFNMYERYYFPQLLGTISIERKTPTKLEAITSILGNCDCRFCRGKNYIAAIESKNSKLHFLELINSEVKTIRSKKPDQRIAYFLERINEAIDNYKKLPSIFKQADYQHLLTWKEVFEELNK